MEGTLLIECGLFGEMDGRRHSAPTPTELFARAFRIGRCGWSEKILPKSKLRIFR